MRDTEGILRPDLDAEFALTGREVDDAVVKMLADRGDIAAEHLMGIGKAIGSASNSLPDMHTRLDSLLWSCPTIRT